MTESLPVDVSTVLAFMLVLSRTASWAMTAPMLSTKGMSAIARLGFSIPLSLFIAMIAPLDRVPLDLPGFVSQALVQVGVGLALGFLTGLLFTAVEIAGSMADFSSGFSFGAIIDPVSGAQSAAFARLNSLAFLAVLVATDSHLAIVRGFVASFRTLPLGVVPGLSSTGAAGLGHALTATMVSALQIGAPLLGVLFLTDVVLAVAARFTPQSNPLQLALPVKGLVALLTAGAVLTLLPAYLDRALLPALELPGIVLQ